MLPFLKQDEGYRKQYIVNFLGLNLGEGYRDGEFQDCENLSSALSPCVSQRFGRVNVGAYTAPTTLHVKDGLVVIDGTQVLHNGEVVGTVTAGRKHTATVGNYVVIYPDKVAYNAVTGEFSSLDATWSGTVTFGVTENETEPCVITTAGADFPFRNGDAITISGSAKNDKTIIVRSVEAKKLTFYENSFEAEENAAVTLSRESPDLDFICESNYRLWGTKGNTIYSSAYSDPFNFQVFDGLAGDSYYIDVGSEGEFTGCVPYSSHICFFKEHTVHKIYGTKPSNFQMVTSQVYGVQAGSERSICTINETVLYKGIHGVYAYSGGIPELISENFGTARFSEACAVTDGERYYISMKSGETWGLYVFDAIKRIWLKEDGLHCVDMGFHDGHVYLLAADGNLWKVDPEADRSDLTWSATFCPFTETVNERKVYSRFHLRLELAEGAWLQVETRLDGGPRWNTVYTHHNQRARTITVPVMPERCDQVEIRLSGKGECLLRTFIREVAMGSDV